MDAQLPGKIHPGGFDGGGHSGVTFNNYGGGSGKEEADW